MGEEIIDISQIPLPREMLRVIHKPEHQPLTRPDRVQLEVAGQLLPAPNLQHVLEHVIGRNRRRAYRQPDHLAATVLAHKRPRSHAKYACRMQNMRIGVREMPGYQQFLRCTLMRRTRKLSSMLLASIEQRDKQKSCNCGRNVASSASGHKHDQGSPTLRIPRWIQPLLDSLRIKFGRILLTSDADRWLGKRCRETVWSCPLTSTSCGSAMAIQIP